MGCEYCKDNKNIVEESGVGIYIDFCGRIATTSIMDNENTGDGYDYGITGRKINFCPMCGKKIE